MAPTILSFVSELLSEYADEDWNNDTAMQQLGFLACDAIGQLTESLGRSEGVDADTLSGILCSILDLERVVGLQIADNPERLAFFNGIMFALKHVIRSAQMSHQAHTEQQRRANRLTPLIEKIQSVLAGHEPEDIDMKLQVAKRLCAILGYDFDDILFTPDIFPLPHTHESRQLQRDLLWLSDNGHIGKMVPAAVSWAFADSLKP